MTLPRELQSYSWPRASSRSTRLLYCFSQVSLVNNQCRQYDHPLRKDVILTPPPAPSIKQLDRADLRQVSHVRRLNLFIGRSLRTELNKNHHLRQPYDNGSSDHPTSANVYETLISKIPHLHEISQLHMNALSRFRRLSPEIEFPALHRELFSTDLSE